MELLFLALLMIIMATALGSGYPVAFALPGAAIITIVLAAASGYLFAGNSEAYFHSGGPYQWLSAGVTNLRGVYWEVERDTLIAIPLFIFMGIMLQKSKIAEDLLVTMAQLFGPVPGGLGISVVFVGALLAATTGIVGATVVAMGLISLPAMLRNNYSKPLASGTIAASGTLGQIIPPSIVLIILADQLASASDQASTARKALHKEATGELSMPSLFDVASTSAGEMFLGAFVPGIVLVLLYMLFILVFALVRPSAAPAVSYEGQRDLRFWGKVLLTLVPPLTLIFLVLGSIISGIATVNQAGAIGAAGALIMAGYRLTENKRGTYIPAIMGLIGLGLIAFALSNYDLNVKSLLASGGDMTGVWIGTVAVALVLIALVWSGLRVLKIENTMYEVMIETAKTTSLVFIILLGAAMLTAAFRAFGGRAGARLPQLAARRVLDAICYRHGRDLHTGLFPGFHRNRGCCGADRRSDPAGRSQCQHYGRLAGGHDRSEHPDIVPDATLRICALLLTRGRPGGGQNHANLPGCCGLHLPAARRARDCRVLPTTGELHAQPG